MKVAARAAVFIFLGGHTGDFFYIDNKNKLVRLANIFFGVEGAKYTSPEVSIKRPSLFLFKCPLTFS